MVSSVRETMKKETTVPSLSRPEEGLGLRLGQARVCGGILPVGGVVLSRVIAGVLRLAARVFVGGIGGGVCGGVPVVFVPFTGAV